MVYGFGCSKAEIEVAGDDVRDARVWRRLVGVDRSMVVEGVEFDADVDAVVVVVRPRRCRTRRCGVCARSAPGYDHGDG